MRINYFIFCLIVFLCGCTSPKENEVEDKPFTEWEGVSLVDSIGIYQYKDTLYYAAINEVNDFVFKIPEGFSAYQGSYTDMDGVHLLNADSTLRIDLTPYDRGIAPYGGEEVTHIDLLSLIACDNSDIKMYYHCDDNGFLKVGYTEDGHGLIDKAVAVFNDEDGIINAHLNMVRFTYPVDSVNRASDINFYYIESWPNNIYK